MARWGFAGWYYYREGEKIGPVHTEEIVRLAKEGVLQPDDELLKAWHIDDEIKFFPSRVAVALGQTS